MTKIRDSTPGQGKDIANWKTEENGETGHRRNGEMKNGICRNAAIAKGKLQEQKPYFLRIIWIWIPAFAGLTKRGAGMTKWENRSDKRGSRNERRENRNERINSKSEY